MIYDWHNIEDLSEASIFDLTDDIELIRECICIPSFEMKNKMEYINSMEEVDRISDFESFAQITGDEEFLLHIRMVFKDFYDQLNQLPEGASWE